MSIEQVGDDSPSPTFVACAGIATHFEITDRRPRPFFAPDALLRPFLTRHAANTSRFSSVTRGLLFMGQQQEAR